MTRQTEVPQDLLILVDPNDTILGYEEKTRCHQEQGLLHRAFSIFLFNPHNQLLLQQRSRHKPLWPLYWSNSVCSHPRKGERDAEAAMRRLDEELGLTVPLRFVFKFQYQAAFQEIGSEHELCSVYIGQIQDQRVVANPNEIADWRFVDLEELQADLTTHPERYTPWFKLEWEQMCGQYAPRLQEILAVRQTLQPCQGFQP